MNKKRPIVDRPYLGALISIPVLLIFIPLFADLISLLPRSFFSNESEAISTFIIAATALIFLLIYKRHLRKENFKGVFSLTRAYKKDVYIAVLIALFVDVLCLLFWAIFMLGGLDRLVAPTITTIGFSLYAGVLEETVFRAVPISIMMKNSPDNRRIVLSVILTSLIFGLLHLTNISDGALVSVTLMQVIFSVASGFLWAAIYLRTGSIAIPMFYHFFHDVINMMLPSNVTGTMLQDSVSLLDILTNSAFGLLELVFALYLLRKIHFDDIKNTWATIWNE